MGAAQRFRVAERVGLVEITGCYRVAVLVAWVQRPQHLYSVHLVFAPSHCGAAARPGFGGGHGPDGGLIGLPRRARANEHDGTGCRGLEADASEIDGYDSELVPGQLQTAEYAEAVILAAHPNTTRDELQRLVTFRHERQERLAGNTPPRLHFVLNEAVLRRPVGSSQGFRQQLDHLAEMAQLPHVDLQVLPFSAGPHAAMGQTFRVVRFPGDEAGLDFAYLENDRGALYLERPADVDRYQAIFAQLTSVGLNSSETSKFLAKVRGETGERE